MKIFGIGAAIIFGLIILGFIAKGCSEVSPDAMLRKYEWFKDTHAKIEQTEKRIKNTEFQLKMYKDTYGQDVSKWSFNVQEEFARQNTVLQGYRDHYNSLASEYNSQSSKFNWKSFRTNVPEQIVEYK